MQNCWPVTDIWLDNCGRATNETERQQPAAVHTPPLPPARSAGRAHAQRPPARAHAQRPPARVSQSAVGGGSPYLRLRSPPPAQPGQPARSARRAACVHPLMDRIGDRCSLLRRSLRGEARRGLGRRSLHGPRGPWGHRSAVRAFDGSGLGGTTGGTRDASRSLTRDAARVPRWVGRARHAAAARRRTARAAWEDGGGTTRTHSSPTQGGTLRARRTACSSRCRAACCSLAATALRGMEGWVPRAHTVPCPNGARRRRHPGRWRSWRSRSRRRGRRAER